MLNIMSWFTDPANWTGSGGIPAQIGYHLFYSAIALLAAMVIAVPLGIFIGYTGRGEALVAGSANALRALPSLGLLVLLFLLISPVVSGKLVYVLPTIIVLMLFAVPPILTGTYAGIQTADPDAVGAARGMGFTKRQILLRVQLPCALPLMVSGVRSSTLQIVSTATIAAYLGLQGLGRFILDGRAQASFSEMAGAILSRPALFWSSPSPGLAHHHLARPAPHRIKSSTISDRPRAGHHLGDHHEETHALSALAITSVLALPACGGGGGNPLSGGGDNKGSSGSEVIVGSADFTESQLVASIYSQALQAAGGPTKEQFNIGSREVYIQALKDGSIDLVPEYSGALLSYLDPKSTAATTEAVTAELRGKLPSGISMLTPSAAQDKDVVAVTKATADKYKLKTVSDLKPVAGELVLGGRRSGRRAPGRVGLRDIRPQLRTSSVSTRVAP